MNVLAFMGDRRPFGKSGVLFNMTVATDCNKVWSSLQTHGKVAFHILLRQTVYKGKGELELGNSTDKRSQIVGLKHRLLFETTGVL